MASGSTATSITRETNGSVSGDDRRRSSSSPDHAQLLRVHELAHHPVVHPQATIGQFGDQTAQGKITGAAAFQQPDPPWPDQLLRPIAADLAGADTARPAHPLHPFDRRADP